MQGFLHGSRYGKGLVLLTLSVWLAWMPRAALAMSAPEIELRPGDVLLIELQCYVCSAIAQTTGSHFNHSGLVISTTNGDIKVAQSLTHTERVPLAQFLGQTHTTRLEILRSRELAALYARDPAGFAQRATKLQDVFTKFMAGRPFDSDYLWDNTDADGGELLYCSEMVQKTLNSVLEQPLLTAPMDYTKAWDFWQRYFDGHVPQGEPGNSPQSLADAPQLDVIYSQP